MKVKSTVSVLAVVLGVALALAPEVVHADDAAAAKAHFAKGTAHFNVGEFAEAAESYKAAYKISQNPIILYNIAQAYRQGGDFNKAIFFYRSYLRNLPNAENKKDVLERLRILEMQVAKTREASTAPPNVPINVDPSRRPDETTTPTDPKEPPITTTTTTTTTPPTTTTTTSASSSSTSTSSNAVVATAPERKTPIYKKWWLWTIVGGVAVVGIGLGVGLGVGLNNGGNVPATDLGTRPVF